MPSRNPDRPRTEQRKTRVRRVLAHRQPDLTLVLANIHDPHNVSAIYRSCDAFGVQRVRLYYTDTAFPVLGRKSSGSARKWVETVRHENPHTLAEDLRRMRPHAAGPHAADEIVPVQLIATGFSEQAKPVTAFDFTRPTAFLLGNEHRGVDPELAALADAEAYIPMRGMVQSLNVSVAAAVMLFEAHRQRALAGMYEHCAFAEEELAAMEAAWIRK